MRTRSRKLVALVVGAAMAVAGASAANADAPPEGASLLATDLTVERQSEPLGVDDAAPLFGWEVTSDAPGAAQTAYEIEVFSAGSDAPDLWDTGRVESSQSFDISYGGADLESRAAHTWRVRVWDEAGVASPWSDPATFETAFLDDDEFGGDWIGSPARRPATTFTGAGWIWTDGGGAGGNAPAGDRFFRTTFDLPAGVDIVSAQIQATADDYFVLSVNGTEALRSPTSGEAWRTPRVADVSDRLTAGRNVLAARVTNGAQGFAGLLGKLRVELSDGRVVEINTDASWRAATAAAAGWDQPGFDDSAWPAAVVGAAYGGGPWGSNISAPTPPEALLRKDFTVAKEVAKARAYVTGLGFYKLYLNGERVGDHELDPGFTVYDETTLYSVYDVTEALRDGENAVGVSLGRGYFGQTFPDEWMSSPWHDDTKLKLELAITYTDGTVERVVSDRTWTAGAGPTTSDSMWMGESYDARREQPGWNTAGFDDASWNPAVSVRAPGGQLRSQAFPAIKVTEPLERVAVATPQAGVTVHDFGEPTAGWADVTVEGPAGATVTITYGEKLRADGTVDNNGGFFNIQTYTYTLKGGGPESYRPSYSYAGFRYVQVAAPAGVTVRDVAGMRVHTAVERTGGFASSDDLLNRYHAAQANTLLNNLHSIPTDTPMYEKRAYGADAFLGADSAIAGFDMQTFYDSWIRSHRDDQNPDGTLGNTVPGTVGGKQVNDPLWTSSYVLMSWNLYWYYGDTRVLAENYEGMTRWMNHYDELISGTGGVYTGFSYGDWLDPTPGGNAGTRLPATAYLIKTAGHLAEIAAVLGYEEDAAHFAEMADRITEAFNATFYDPERGVYVDNADAGYRQTANVLPLAFGIVPDDQHDRVLANLVADVEAREDHLSTGAIGTKYLLPVLTENGYADLAYRVATNPTYPGWGFWFEELGATTMWEEWGANSRSLDHAFLGTVDDWLYQHVAGVQAAGPGYTGIRIQPFPAGGMTTASAQVDSPLGEVSSEWIREGDRFTLTVSVPVGATAEVYVPVAEGDGVSVTPVAVATAHGVEDGYARFTVPSGTYTFVAGPGVGTPEGPEVSVTADTRCVVGRVVQTVRVTNESDVPTTAVITSAHGSKTVTVGADRSTAATFTTRLGSVPAGEVSVSATAEDLPGTTTVTAPYAARACR